MIRDSKNIDNLFKQNFQNLEIKPDKNVWRAIDSKMWLSNFKYYFENLFKSAPINVNEQIWKNINRKLWIQDFLSFNFSKINIYYSSLGLIVMAFILLQAIDNEPEKKLLADNNILNNGEQVYNYSNLTESVNLKQNSKIIIAPNKNIKIKQRDIQRVKKLSKKQILLIEIKKTSDKIIQIKKNQKVKQLENTLNFNKTKNNPFKFLSKKYNLNNHKFNVKNRSNKWSLGVYTKLNSNRKQSDDILAKKENAQIENYGISVGYNFNNFLIETGVAFSKTTDLHLTSDSISLVVNTNVSNFIIDSIISFDNDTSLSYSYLGYNLNEANWDSLTSLKLDTTSISDVLNAQNQYKSVEIPIMFGYKFSQKNIDYTIKGGLISALYYRKEDKFITNRNDITEIKTRNTLVKKDFSFSLALGVEYKLNESISLLGEPFYRKTLNKIYANKSKYVQNYNDYGLKIGVKYYL